jgi:hypothetical protein
MDSKGSKNWDKYIEEPVSYLVYIFVKFTPDTVTLLSIQIMLRHIPFEDQALNGNDKNNTCIKMLHSSTNAKYMEVLPNGL